jgi:hypothetical protein
MVIYVFKRIFAHSKQYQGSNSTGQPNSVEINQEIEKRYEEEINDVLAHYIPQLFKQVRNSDALTILAWSEEVRRLVNKDIPLNIRYAIARAIKMKFENYGNTIGVH